MADNSVLSLLPALSQNLLEIFDDNEYCDINIEVGNGEDVKTFRSHMIILHYRSPYLRRILSTKNEDGTLTNIKLPNISPDIFQIILTYIYGGRLPYGGYDNLDIIKILLAANELGLQELTTSLQHLLIEKKANWVEQNFNLIYKISFENNSFSELQKYCTDLISREPDKIFKSLDLSSISEELLISIIQSDNIQMSEIQVWENVLEWGLYQNPELPTDITNFSKEDFNILKSSLEQCIPLIRFCNLTSEEFSENVLPYKKILPKDLYKDLLKYFLNSDNQSTKESKPRKGVNKDEGKAFGSYNKSAGQGGYTTSQNELITETNEPSKTSIYVSNIPYYVNDEFLKNVFKGYNVSSARIACRRNGRSKGYGFVELAEEEELNRALEELKGYEFGGRVLSFERSANLIK